MIPQVSAALQMFLISISILMLAIAIARTDALKTLISLMALGTSLLCLVRVWTWKEVSFGDRFTAVALALIFIVATAASTFVYGKAASRRGGLSPTGFEEQRTNL
jgi:hypothetical protein